MPFNSVVIPSTTYYSNWLMDWAKTTIANGTGYSIVDDWTGTTQGNATRILVFKLSSLTSGRSADLYGMLRLFNPTTGNSVINITMFENYRTSDRYVQRPILASYPVNTDQNYYGTWAADDSHTGSTWVDILTNGSISLPGAYTSNSVIWQAAWYNNGSPLSSGSEVSLTTTNQGIRFAQRGASYGQYLGFYDSAIPNAATADPFPSVLFNFSTNYNNEGWTTRAPLQRGTYDRGGGGRVKQWSEYPSIASWYNTGPYPGGLEYFGDAYQSKKVALYAIPVLNQLWSKQSYPYSGPDTIGFYRGTLATLRYAQYNSSLVSYGDYITVDGQQWVNLQNQTWVRNDA